MIDRSDYFGGDLATHKVNLEALIKREDFNASAGSKPKQGTASTFKLDELQKDKLYYKVLRKPDFQRITDNWTPEMIVDFVVSFLDWDMIPSIILWHSQDTGNVFVIDGAHRVSALIAWVNDDYGNGSISREALNFEVPNKQIEFHEKTKALMAERKIGDYTRLYAIGLNPQGEDAITVNRAKAIGTRQLYVQIVDGDGDRAQESFLRINNNPATIDPTELSVIRARRKPNTIAMRAILSRGTARTYWEKFSATTKKQIEKFGLEAYDLIFGELNEISANSPDIPRAGQPYSHEAFTMMLDMVNRLNQIKDSMWKTAKKRAKKLQDSGLADDADGSQSIKFIKKVIRANKLISGRHKESLGLDPAVYFYGETGKIHPFAILAALEFAEDLRQRDQLKSFTKVRNKFEEFLVKYKTFINEIGHSKGSRTRPVESMKSMLLTIFECMKSGTTGNREIIDTIRSDSRLTDVAKKLDPENLDQQPPQKNFSKSVERVAVIHTILQGRSRCSYCKARMTPDGRCKDHKKRVQDGGLGTLKNLQFTHFYCNTGAKESEHAKKVKAGKHENKSS
jgi:Protein of unknown function DUF262